MSQLKANQKKDDEHFLSRDCDITDTMAAPTLSGEW